jgi:hypothetical protein
MPSLFSGEVLDRLPRLTHSPACLAEAQDTQARLIVRRAKLLPEYDRRLVMLAVKHRLSVREIATLLRVNHGTVARRVRKLKRRLCDPTVVSLVDPNCPLSPLDRELALDYYLRRQSLRAIARSRGLCIRELRRRLQYVPGWLTGRREGARAVRALSA